MRHASDTSSNPGSPRPRVGVVRQTVEFLLILSVCILVFRTFAAEAYIVPTGSMAPTLLGNHKEVPCPNCSYRFALGQDDEDRAGRAICPNCGQAELERVPTIDCNGDRVLVQKFVYDFRRPRRWEVAVFHFPNEPSQAYVKRVVGLPNESIQILGGDIYVDGQIARKTLKEQRAMRVLVFDNHFVPKDSDRFPRWRPQQKGSWCMEGDQLVHDTKEVAEPRHLDWVEYCHWDPDRGKYWPVYDFNPYNGADLRGENRVDDLMVEANLTVGDDVQFLAIRINSGSDQFVVKIPANAADHVGALGSKVTRYGNGHLHSEWQFDSEQVARGLRGKSVRLEASVMDHRLSVALDGKLLFDPIDYDDPSVGSGPGAHPIALGAEGGTLTVGDLRIFRDVHYTSVLAHTPRKAFGVDAPYVLGPDEFFVLGDNSAVSNDSRFWAGSPVVQGKLFLGKPFLVHLPGQVVPLEVFGRSVYWVPDPREIRYIR